MKKLIFFLTLFLISCTTSSLYNWKYSLLKPDVSETLTFSDENIDISFEIGNKMIGFQLQNKTENAIKIEWDNFSFVSPSGESQRMIHSGIKLVDKNISQTPTTIAPNAKLTDVLVPSEHIYYDKVFGQGWQKKDLFSAKDKAVYIGKEFSIYMPLEIKGEQKDYTFTFKIEDVIKKKTQSSE